MATLVLTLTRTATRFVLVLSALCLFAENPEGRMLDAPIEQLQVQLESGSITAVELVRW